MVLECYNSKMTGLLGEFECRLDNKGRLALPSALKRQLCPESEGRFVINRGFEPHLTLYPMTEWQRITGELSQLNPYVKKHRDFLRYFYRGATELAVDGHGRLLLPKRLLSYAGIESQVVLLAYGWRIECWQPEKYDQFLQDEPEDFARLAEDVMGQTEKESSDASIPAGIGEAIWGQRH